MEQKKRGEQLPVTYKYGVTDLLCIVKSFNGVHKGGPRGQWCIFTISLFYSFLQLLCCPPNKVAKVALKANKGDAKS